MKTSSNIKVPALNLLMWFVLAALVVGCSSDDAIDNPDPAVDTPSAIPGVFSVQGADNTFNVPYFSNYNLTETNTSIERLVVVLHGTGRTAESYFQAMASATQNAATEENTLVIAPRFILESDLGESGYGEDYLYWTNDGWKEGLGTAGSSGGGNPLISSYEVMDQLITQVTNDFPSLKKIVFAGHSAGGQYFNRYAAVSPIHQLTDEKGISVKYIIANPSSYMYLNNERRIEGYDDLFRTPPKPSCGDYNEYKYGLEKLNQYMGQVTPETIREQYKNRNVVYLLGELDNDPNSSDLDTDCAAMMQGSNRLERGIIFFNYLKHLYGNSISESQSLETVPGAGHDKARMFDSKEGRAVIFQD